MNTKPIKLEARIIEVQPVYGTCRCGWKGPERPTAVLAERDWEDHKRRLHRTQRGDRKRDAMVKPDSLYP